MYASAWMRVPVADRRVVLDQRAAAEDAVVCQLDALADARLVADDAVRADRGAGEDDRAGRDDGALADRGPAEAARASRSSSRRASAACRRPRARARARRRRGSSPRGRPRLGEPQPPPSDSVSISRARTTRAPSRATLPRSCCPSISSRKYAHSSRSGSAVEIFGMKMSPEWSSPPVPARLLVDRHLALGLHVVEDDHLLAADDGHLAHLVRVEPREVHVRDLAAREAEEAEDDVLRRRRGSTRFLARSRGRDPRRAGRGSPTGRGRRATRVRSRSLRTMPRLTRLP